MESKIWADRLKQDFCTPPPGLPSLRTFGATTFSPQSFYSRYQTCYEIGLVLSLLTKQNEIRLWASLVSSLLRSPGFDSRYFF